MESSESTFAGELIAKLLNITERRLQQLAKDGIVPKAARGKYPLAGCVRGYVTYLQGLGGNESAPDKMDPFRRKAHFQAESTKLAMERAAGDLVPVEEVRAEMANIAKAVIQTLDILPDVLERDAGISPKAVARCQELISLERDKLAKMLAS